LGLLVVDVRRRKRPRLTIFWSERMRQRGFQAAFSRCRFFAPADAAL